MAAPSQTAVALAALLAEEVREVEAFVALLEREQGLLAPPGDIDALLPLAETKAGFAGRLKELSDRRERLVAAAGHAPGRIGVEALIAGLPDPAALLGLWRRLLELAQQARDLNETNGRLISLHLQCNQQALAALSAAADRVTTYGPDGQQQQGGGGRSLGSA